MTTDDFIQIGQIYREHGVNGFCKVHIFSGGDDNLTVGASYELRHATDGSRSSVQLAQVGSIGRYFLLKFVKIATPEALLKWRKAGLWMAKARLTQVADGEMYDHEWIGFVVMDQSQRVLGRVSGLSYTPLRQWIVVGTDGREFLIPLTPAWVVHLDRKAKRVSVDLPEGILDLS